MPRTHKSRRKPGPTSVIGPQRKQLILSFIHEYRRINQISPTYEQIARGIGYSAKAEGTVFTLVEELIAEGWLKRAAPGARAIVPVHPPATQYAIVKDENLKLIERQQHGLRILRRL